MLDGLIRLLQWLAEVWFQHLSPFIVLCDYEEGVILRMGKYKKNLVKGINFKIPLMDATMTTIVTKDTYHVANVNVTTIDGKTISVGAIVEFEITDIRKFFMDINEAHSNAHDITRGVIADYISDIEWIEVKKKTTLTQIKNKLKPQMEAMGMSVTQIMFGDIAQSRVFTVFKE
ncbi:MAG: SPFH domain-containing protein [Alphaproteobacteria bacterium]